VINQPFRIERGSGIGRVGSGMVHVGVDSSDRAPVTWDGGQGTGKGRARSGRGQGFGLRSSRFFDSVISDRGVGGFKWGSGRGCGQTRWGVGAESGLGEVGQASGAFSPIGHR
jgi:hypothetical protein